MICACSESVKKWKILVLKCPDGISKKKFERVRDWAIALPLKGKNKEKNLIYKFHVWSKDQIHLMNLTFHNHADACFFKTAGFIQIYTEQIEKYTQIHWSEFSIKWK
jgi:hypothetical protein